MKQTTEGRRIKEVYTLEELKDILRNVIGGKVFTASNPDTWGKHNYQNELKSEQIVRACELLNVETLS